MKIFAPLRDKEHVKALSEAGADELYCGLVIEEWKNKFGNSVEMNRRSACGKEANFMNIEDTRQSIEIAHTMETKVVLALNHHMFVKRQLELVYETIDLFMSVGGDGVILADINAIRYAKSKGYFVAGSTDLNIYNVEGAKWLADLGVDRIILSRDIPFETIDKIKKEVKDVEVESFMINGPCKFSDSMCLGLHSTPYGAFCRFIGECQYSFQRKDEEALSEDEKAHIQDTYKIYLHDYMNASCGLCAMWKLIQHNIDACKVVGRVLPLDRVCNDIRLVKQNIKIAEKCTSEEEYLSKMLRREGLEKCKNGFQCFYPNEKYYV